MWTANALVAAFLLTFLFAVAIYDFIAFFRLGNEFTISYVFRSWCRHNPILVLLLGMLVWHLLMGEEQDPSPPPSEAVHGGNGLPRVDRPGFPQ